jgi:hypothetical protein
MQRYGITGVAMRFRKLRQIPIRWKATTLNSGIIWLAWLVRPDAFHVVRMPCIVLSVCLLFISTSVNSENTSSLSTPFTSPILFTHPFSHSLKSGGRFAGQFFGVNDSWANNPEMTFHTEEQVRALFDGFEVESFHEQDEDGSSLNGPKHWHIFTVIARKK